MRQAKDFAQSTNAYEAFLVYHRRISQEVVKQIEGGHYRYHGMNDYGRVSKLGKYVIVVGYVNGGFKLKKP